MSLFRALKWVGMAGWALMIWGCHDWDTNSRKIEPIVVNHALTKVGSCDDYLAYTKETAIQQMRTRVEVNCKQMLEEANHSGGGWFGGVFFDGDAQRDSAESSNDMDGSTGSGTTFSQTNNQEDGVDEADILKTDGDYIYVLSGDELVVVSVAPEGQLVEQGRIALHGNPKELFLYGDTAVIFSALDSRDVPDALHYPDAPQGNNNYYYDEPWEDDVEYWQNDLFTGIFVVDLTNRDAPTLLSQKSYAGRYVSSRRVANALRAVLSSPMPALEVQTYPNVNYWDLPRDRARHKVNKACDALIERNIETINAITLADILPKKIGSEDTEASPVAACENIYGPQTPAGTGLLTIMSMDLESPLDDQKELGVLGEEGLVYASQSSLYITTARNYAANAWGSGLWMEETSGIHKFDIENKSKEATYVATGTVTGRMLDQFCLGEHEGFLRVATTTGSAWFEDNTLDNHITIFEQQGKELNEISRIDGIGKEEEIYASRFMGNRGFLVTFFQTDPLYTFDLSDPHNPKVIGEWLGPGYSTYLHPYGDDLLIAMGVDEDWRTVISLYNLKDFADPTLVERQPLPGEQYETAALYEHKAFTFNPNTGELLLPFHSYGSYNMNTGVLLYDITEAGVARVGTLRMGGDPSMEGPARRSLYNGENLIGVSECRITSAPLAKPSATISSIPLYRDSCNYPEWWEYR